MRDPVRDLWLLNHERAILTCPGVSLAASSDCHRVMAGSVRGHTDKRWESGLERDHTGGVHGACCQCDVRGQRHHCDPFSDIRLRDFARQASSHEWMIALRGLNLVAWPALKLLRNSWQAHNLMLSLIGPKYPQPPGNEHGCIANPISTPALPLTSTPELSAHVLADH